MMYKLVNNQRWHHSIESLQSHHSLVDDCVLLLEMMMKMKMKMKMKKRVEMV